MNIILQNYKQLIENIIKNCILNKIDNAIKDFNGINNINNYISLISNFDEALCNCFKEAFIKLIEEIDMSYCNSVERKRKYHIKDYYSRTILTIFGEVTYNRTYYKSKLNGKSFCYVDRLLGLKKYDYFDPYIKAEILDYASENNYSETANHINSLIGNRISIEEKKKYLSRQSVRNTIINAKLSDPKIEKLSDVDSIYIIADEKWIPTQNNKKKKVMQKSIVIFDGFNKIGKRKSLNNKTTFSGRNDNFIYEALDYIEKAYDTSKIKYFYMLGDGAPWIKNLKYYFNCYENVQIIQGLDHFHFKQALWRIWPTEDVYNYLVECTTNNNKEDFERIISEIIDLKPDRKEKIEEYNKYINNNWNNIQNIFKYKLSCPMESQISHTFASYFTSRPKAYNKNMINLLIKLRLLKKNRHNIKKLYLNNLNIKKEINIEDKPISFSIFNNKDTYTLNLRKIFSYKI
jgi:hypothetical protein